MQCSINGRSCNSIFNHSFSLITYQLTFLRKRKWRF